MLAIGTVFVACGIAAPGAVKGAPATLALASLGSVVTIAIPTSFGVAAAEADEGASVTATEAGGGASAAAGEGTGSSGSAMSLGDILAAAALFVVALSSESDVGEPW